MRRIRLSSHAKLQCKERGASEEEVIEAVLHGVREPAKKERYICKYNFRFDACWQGKRRERDMQSSRWLQ